MGEVRVPAEALWRAQTQRAVENFPISGVPINSELIAALGLIKEAAAKTNAALGVLSQDYADVIEKAASEVAANLHDTEFPIDVFQTGSGTSSNMNANEVIASLPQHSWAKTCIPMITSMRHSPATTSSPAPFTSRQRTPWSIRCCRRCVIWKRRSASRPPSSPRWSSVVVPT